MELSSSRVSSQTYFPPPQGIFLHFQSDYDDFLYQVKILLFTLISFLSSAILHGLNFPIFATLMILGLGSFSEFEFRRKVGTNFNLPRILPSSIQAKRAAKLAKDPPIKKPGDSDCSEASDETFMKAFIQAFINFSFLLLNYYHLFFVGSVFGSHDLPMIDTLIIFSLKNWTSPMIIFAMLFYSYFI